MRCPHCTKDMKDQVTITAIDGKLMCNRCFAKSYSLVDLLNRAEKINPIDIGLKPAAPQRISTLKETKTLEHLLSKTQDEELIDIYNEIASAIVPATGYAHSFCRKINKLIDQGKLCINTTTYRKVYLPTLAKALQKELARRYVEKVLIGKIEL